MYHDAVERRNYAALVAASNDTSPVHVTDDERRIRAQSICNARRGPEHAAFWSAFQREVKDSDVALNGILHDLAFADTLGPEYGARAGEPVLPAGWQPELIPPGDMLVDMKLASAPLPIRYIMAGAPVLASVDGYPSSDERLRRTLPFTDGAPKRVAPQELYRSFCRWAADRGHNTKWTCRGFVLLIRDELGLGSTKSNGRRRFVFSVATTAAMLEAIRSKFGDATWSWGDGED